MTTYAVNRKTKEHRIAKTGESWYHPWQLLAADKDGWVEWFGGECPLPNDQPCEAKTRNGEQQKFKAAGHVIGWKKAIIAYRPILDADTGPTIDVTRLVTSAEPPAWDGEGLPPVGCECECTFAVEDHDTWHRGVVTLRGVAPEGHEIVAIKVDDIIAVYRSAKHIRPIRSDEDKAIEAIESAYREGSRDNLEGSFTSIYAAIRDGKIPGVRLED